MNREHAKDLFRNDKNSYGGVKAPMSKIDLIYEEFGLETRIIKKALQECQLELGEQDYKINNLEAQLKSKDELLMEALTKYARLYEYKLSNIETDDFYEKAQNYISKES